MNRNCNSLSWYVIFFSEYGIHLCPSLGQWGKRANDSASLAQGTQSEGKWNLLSTCPVLMQVQVLSIYCLSVAHNNPGRRYPITPILQIRTWLCVRHRHLQCKNIVDTRWIIDKWTNECVNLGDSFHNGKSTVWKGPVPCLLVASVAPSLSPRSSASPGGKAP